MMAVIGFIACVIVMLWLSATSVLVAANSLGRYTIGGVPNTWVDRAGALLLIAGLFCGWYLVLHFAPFTLTFKAAS